MTRKSKTSLEDITLGIKSKLSNARELVKADIVDLIGKLDKFPEFKWCTFHYGAGASGYLKRGEMPGVIIHTEKRPYIVGVSYILVDHGEINAHEHNDYRIDPYQKRIDDATYLSMTPRAIDKLSELIHNQESSARRRKK